MIWVLITVAVILALFYFGAGLVLCVRLALPPTSPKRFVFNLVVLLFWPAVVALVVISTYIDTELS